MKGKGFVVILLLILGVFLAVVACGGIAFLVGREFDAF